MQCWNCGFENLPGARSCARCASPSDLATADVAPPRAGVLRAGTRLRRLSNRTRLSLPDLRRFPGWRHVIIPEHVDWSAFAWSIVPGLGHIRLKRKVWGRALLFVWSALLLAALAMIATEWTPYFLAGAALTHTMAFVSLLAANISYERVPMRVCFGILAFLCVRFCLYEPSLWVGSRFLTPLPLPNAVRGNDVLLRGDGFLAQGPWTRPAVMSRGDVVAYEVHYNSGPGYVVQGGRCIDRIVGVPGDRVRVASGQVYLNDDNEPSAHQPLGSVPFSVVMDRELAQGEYAIVPTMLSANLYGRDGPDPVRERVVRDLTVVWTEDVVGRVWWRIRPWSRMGRVE